MNLLEQESQHLQNPTSPLDRLFCEEESIEDDPVEFSNQSAKKEPSLDLLKHDLLWEDDEILNLISRQKRDRFCFSIVLDECLVLVRKEAIDWIFRVKEHHGFTALTTVLAVNYFDRFVLSSRYQKEKPWMSQLVAVACLSLAAKVEETHAPLLLDLQVEESKYIFEAKTIQRMELLVLSTLQWRMNLVTPISFFDHISRRLGLKIHLNWEFMWRCEDMLLSVIADARFMCYLPSMLATAIMLFVIQEVDSCKQVEYRNLLMNVLKANEEKVKEIYKLILELTSSHGNHKQGYKRKDRSRLGSPNGVIDALLSSDSSNDSWAMAPSASSSSPQFKRSRVKDQRVSTFADVLSSPR